MMLLKKVKRIHAPQPSDREAVTEVTWYVLGIPVFRALGYLPLAENLPDRFQYMGKV